MSDTILSGLIEKALYPEAGSNWACRDWRTVSTLLDAAGEQASDAVMDLIGLLSDTAEAQQAEIARLTDENERLTREMLDAENERLHEEVADEHMRVEEAREAARWNYERIVMDDGDVALARWPWLEDKE